MARNEEIGEERREGATNLRQWEGQSFDRREGVGVENMKDKGI